MDGKCSHVNPLVPPSMNTKTAIEEVFTKPLAELIWTANTLTVYPATLQNFSVGSVLPAVFYMFRRGHRRGRGRFQEEFSPSDKGRPSIFWVALRLSQDAECFEGFDSQLPRDILGDLLLCDALENKKHAEGQTEEIQRAFPVHFFASWLDLPPSAAHLRFVPEMLVALLANQPTGRTLNAVTAGDFTLGVLPHQNIFFRIFGRGVDFGSNIADLCADSILEEPAFSVEELLMIRLGQTCRQAPEKLRGVRGGTPEMQNFVPLASAAANIFREDLAVFLRHFGEAIPRRALTPMLETLIGLGVMHTLFASLAAVVAWESTGVVPDIDNQRSFSLFVDASSGTDTRLRDLSERSQEDMLRFLDEAIVALAVVRVMDALGRHSPVLSQFVPTGPSATAWLNVLGQVRLREHPKSDFLLYDLGMKVNLLAAKLGQEGVENEALEILRTEAAQNDPARALAEATCAMMGEKALRGKYLNFIDSAALVNEPHGLARKRRVSRVIAGGKRKMMDARSFVLSNTLLEALVHRHLAGREGRFSLDEFVRLLRDRYGLFVDQASPGLTAGREDLLRNRAILERRLRELGLLVGVNDAESMKHLRSHYRHSVMT
jgi:hypothetical protein